MSQSTRTILIYSILFLGLAAVAWAVSFGTLPPADFTFANNDDVQTIDPAKATGQIENRILGGLFEGLLRNMPTSDEPGPHGEVTMKPSPAAAESYTVSGDGKTYTFRIRPTARWSNGQPVTAHDFVWSWRRCLHPETGARYAYQLYYVAGAEQYNTAAVQVGDRVEVELNDRRDRLQPFPRGTILRGVLRDIEKPSSASAADDAEADQPDEAESAGNKRWVYVVEVKPRDNAAQDGDSLDEHAVQWDAQGTLRRFSLEPPAATSSNAGIEQCLQVLIDFDSQVGARAADDRTLVVTLKNRTPYFDKLASFYTLFPVNRECVERYGSPQWTKSENIVTNGPYRLEFRRIRDRVRMVKNPSYWNADQVNVKVIDAMAVKSLTTSLNMYFNGQLDWATMVPRTMVPELKSRDDFSSAPALITYFYRLNVTRKPLDDVRVRRALNMAIDKRQICERVTKAGEQPARSLVPPGMAGYEGALCPDFNVAEARRILADAGYPGGRGLPRLQILYNTDENHRAIAEVIGQHWKNKLGVDVELRNLEWGVYLDSQRKLDYLVCRAGWVGDYADPNTFLDMFVTGGGQNETGWSNLRYDALIAQAAAEPDSTRRLQLLHEAEEILMAELPIIPIYFYVSTNMVKPRVKGFAANILDDHPLHLLRIEQPGAAGEADVRN